MKSRRQVYVSITALCVLSATLVGISLKVRSASVQAANSVYPANAQPSYLLDLPSVDEFTLTPPDAGGKTTLSMRFQGAAAARLAAQIPITLGSERVVLRRVPDDPRVFSTRVDFDWQDFSKEQQQRKEAAAAGKQIPIFDGRRFLGMERMQFVEPSEIQSALTSHQPIHFPAHVLSGGPANVNPALELTITQLSVVEDLTRVWDGCLSGNQGNPNGAWTFKTLMAAIAGDTSDPPQKAEAMLYTMLRAWQTPQSVNGFTVPPRPLIGVLGQSGFLGNWPVDTQNGQFLPSLDNPPVRLTAIVNRIDLGQNSNSPTPGGELRFVFNVTAGTGTGQSCLSGNPFNIILEFNVPSAYSATAWAKKWNSLGTSEVYNETLESITNDVVSCGGSCLAQIRTNELALGSPVGFWEQREFHFAQDVSGNAALPESTVAMTPDDSFNFGVPQCGQQGMPACTTAPGTLNSYISANQDEIVKSLGALPPVPAQYNGSPFLGGSAFNNNNEPAFWQDQTPCTPNSQPPCQSALDRIYFSANTCNGCHGRETATAFLQVGARATGAVSNLSDFLLGCRDSSDSCVPGSQQQCALNTVNLACVENVPDPAGLASQPTPFGDLARRVTILSGLIGTTPQSGGMLLPFVNRRIGVH